MTKKRKIIIAATVAVALVLAVVLFLLCRNRADLPDSLNLTVAWNPHSTACDMARALSAGAEIDLYVQNIAGAHGSNGLNAVFAAPLGENMLSTSLSAFVTAEPMGFAESSRHEWTGWLMAFSPAVIVVAADSHITNIEYLRGYLRGHLFQTMDEIRAANSGFGTVSFIAAQLFAQDFPMEFEHVSFAGSSPAINAVLRGEVDFAVLTTVEAAAAVQNGQIRIIYELEFGEYYGIFVPLETPESRQNAIENMLRTAAESEEFTTFAYVRGLVPLTPERDSAKIDRLCALICQTLLDAGFLPAP
jgi:tripartite-type tricarboxylate transporter receptor subunit TctC